MRCETLTWLVALAAVGVQASAISAHGQLVTPPAEIKPEEAQVSSENKSATVSMVNTAAAVASPINIDSRPVRGEQDAKVTIIEFDDFQCPFSARMHKAVDEVMSGYADRVRLVTRDAPNILIHPWSIHAAVNANCLASQSADAYWDFSDAVFANQSQINAEETQAASFVLLDKMARDFGQKHQLKSASLEECIQAQSSDAEVKRSRRDAIEKVGIVGVPTLFINGEKITGVMTAQQLRERLDRALHTAAQPVPKSTTTMTVPARETAPSSASSHQTKSIHDF